MNYSHKMERFLLLYSLVCEVYSHEIPLSQWQTVYGNEIIF
jgi:hypothetical protein